METHSLHQAQKHAHCPKDTCIFTITRLVWNLSPLIAGTWKSGFPVRLLFSCPVYVVHGIKPRCLCMRERCASKATWPAVSCIWFQPCMYYKLCQRQKSSVCELTRLGCVDQQRPWAWQRAWESSSCSDHEAWWCPMILHSGSEGLENPQNCCWKTKGAAVWCHWGITAVTTAATTIGILSS